MRFHNLKRSSLWNISFETQMTYLITQEMKTMKSNERSKFLQKEKRTFLKICWLTSVSQGRIDKMDQLKKWTKRWTSQKRESMLLLSSAINRKTVLHSDRKYTQQPKLIRNEDRSAKKLAICLWLQSNKLWTKTLPTLSYTQQNNQILRDKTRSTWIRTLTL